MEDARKLEKEQQEREKDRQLTRDGLKIALISTIITIIGLAIGYIFKIQ